MLLYLLISGDVLYVGLGLIVIGIPAERWRPMLGHVLSATGLVLSLASAIAIHPLAYVALVLTSVAWLFAGPRGSNVKRGAGTTVVIAVIVTLALALTGRRPLRVDGPKTSGIFVIGDSLSAGLTASKDQTWPQILGSRLGRPVVNLAQPGATLAMGKRQARSITDDPALVLIELGGNDLLGGTSVNDFATDLLSLLSTVSRPNRRVVMFELPLLPFQNSYGHIQRRICGEWRVELLPRHLLAGAVAWPGNVSDGLHLTPKGHLWLADQVSQRWSED